ncbi:MAG TPA: MerR family transcriptional regulator [Limnobacter sp.]|uniref:MerR family transcriptional regulator n=1 Tax=Limnobacter sp. TaxID=2003368 RepID=UPI002E36CB40|nr:MerR family transcriptional regulator [Limnobacter sp.]HEX5486191.1 MerR family transcriptional regulator [Limnobacter sp.]
MNTRSEFDQPMFSIAAVERDTGLSKDTLRVWEKRYEFPVPARDEFGERIYPTEQVEKLRMIKRLLDAGHRPGKIIKLSADELSSLAAVSSAGTLVRMPADGVDELQDYLELIKQGKSDEFKQTMSRLVLTRGLRRFVVDVVAPMNVLVGDAWARGYFEIFEEHLYTEVIQVVLRNALSTIQTSFKGPRVLLTTLPNELHGLGLLMAECIFGIEGAHTISLGTQTPIYDIGLACQSKNVDVVALSFSSVQSSPAVVDAVMELKRNLPPNTEVWCGGASSALRKRKSDDFILLDTLDDIVSAVTNWRRRHPDRA